MLNVWLKDYIKKLIVIRNKMEITNTYKLCLANSEKHPLLTRPVLKGVLDSNEQWVSVDDVKKLILDGFAIYGQDVIDNEVKLMDFFTERLEELKGK